MSRTTTTDSLGFTWEPYLSGRYNHVFLRCWATLFNAAGYLQIRYRYVRLNPNPTDAELRQAMTHLRLAIYD